MEVFQVQSSSHSTASTHLDLDPQGLFLHQGCSAGIYCPVISPLLRSPQEPTQHPRANHTEVTEVGAGVTQVSAGVTQACAMAREGKNPPHPPIPGSCYTFELTIWRSPSINQNILSCMGKAWKSSSSAIQQHRACLCSLARAGSERGGHCSLPNDALFQLASLRIN